MQTYTMTADETRRYDEGDDTVIREIAARHGWVRGEMSDTCEIQTADGIVAEVYQ